MKANKAIAAIIVVLIFFNIFVQTVQAITVQVKISGYRDYDLAQQVFELTNKTRRERGVRTLSLDKELTELAMKRAEEIALNFAHTRPNNTPWYTISYNVNGENLAIGQSSPEVVISQWMRSTTHRKNLLHTAYYSMGVGYFRCGNTNYWVQMFSAKKANEEPDNIGKTEEYTTTVEIEESILGNLRLDYGVDLSVKEGSRLDLINAIIENSAFINSNVERELKYTWLNKDELTYTSSDTSIATVDNYGNVYGIKEGTVEITATFYDKQASYYIDVLPSDNGTVITFEEKEIDKIRNDEFVKGDTLDKEEMEEISTENTQLTKEEKLEEIVEEQLLLGDLNLDGIVNADDAAYAIELFKTCSETEDDLKRGDMNNDGVINAEDAGIIIEIFKTSK